MATGVSLPQSVDVRVLGPLEIVGPRGQVELRPGLPRSLMTALLLRRRAAVPAEVLLDELWSDRLPEHPANALQVQISQLRRRLRSAGDGIEIVRQGSGYRLVVEPTAIDAWRFEKAVQEVAEALPRPADTAAAKRLLGRLDDALGTWRGTPYADVMYLSHAEGEVARLEELRLVALEQRAELLNALGRHAETVTSLQPVIAEHPLRERLWWLLVVALYRSGRQADALRACGAARNRLVEELGIEPGPDLRALEAAVLAQDRTLDWEPLPDADDGEVLSGRLSDELPATPEEGRARRSAIPASVSPLIGRRWEVEAVGELVDENRLVTLIGPGGVGKTRLAYEAARTRDTPVGVVELAAVTDPSGLRSVVASAVAVPTTHTLDPIEAVANRIGDEQWLLVLDNCEHLVDDVAVAAATLLRRCENLHILATSRQPLNVTGERAWPVPALELPDHGSVRPHEVAAAASVRLFVERAKATNPRFELTADNSAAVAAICRALDGLPLAIELAAARSNVLSTASILERLSDRFGLLTKGGRDAASRHRSLRATVEWSVDLLEPGERRFFSALGAFAGSFDLAAAEAVAGPVADGPALDVLAALVERSLVVASGDDRYALLDTLRAFAREQLDAAADPLLSPAAVRRRHADWYCALAVASDRYSHGPVPEGWPRLRAAAADIREALRWAFGPSGDASVGARMVGALAGSMVLEGRFSEAEEWLGRARTYDADDWTVATVMRGVAIVDLYRGRYGDSVSAARVSVVRARAAGDDVLVASCCLPLGSALWGIGELDESIGLLGQAAELFDAAHDVRGRGFALARLSRSLTDAGDTTAVEVATAAVDDLESSSDDWMTVVALEHLGYALLRAGDPVAAGHRAEQAMALAERIGSYSGGLSALTLLGRALLAAGDTDGARSAHEDAVERALRVGNAGAVADNLEGLAEVEARIGAWRKAVALLASADSVRRQAGVAPPARREAARRACEGALREHLGPAEYEAAAAEGLTPRPVNS